MTARKRVGHTEQQLIEREDEHRARVEDVGVRNQEAAHKHELEM